MPRIWPNWTGPSRGHVVGGDGGAWIYEVGSDEELELLLAKGPVFDFARYDTGQLAEMAAPRIVD